MLELTDRETGKVYAWTNLLINRKGLKGASKQDGYVQVHFDENAQSLIFDGALGSVLSAEVNYGKLGVLRELQSYALVLTTKDGLKTFVFDRPVPVPSLLPLQQKPALPPKVVVVGESSPFRLAALYRWKRRPR